MHYSPPDKNKMASRFVPVYTDEINASYSKFDWEPCTYRKYPGYEIDVDLMGVFSVTYTYHDTYRQGVGAPVVGEIEGDYHYDHKHSVLEWQLPVIDESNQSGAMEFSISGHPDDFFPIHVSFGSTKSFCDVKVSLLIFEHTSTTSVAYLNT